MRQHGNIQPIMAVNDNGYFCVMCPVIILDHEAFNRVAGLEITSPEDAQFVVLGLVDMDAVPDDKKSVPFDDKDNTFGGVHQLAEEAVTREKTSYYQSKSPMR